MPNVDADGCRIIVVRPALVESDDYSSIDVSRLTFSFLEILANMEETQIAGVKVIYDYTNVTMKFFRKFSSKNFRNLSVMLRSPLWFRVKVLYFLNLPKFAVQIINFFIGFLKEKLKKRVVFMENQRLENCVDKNALLQEYGGNVSIEDSEIFLKHLFLEMRDNVRLLGEIDADFGDNFEAVASGSEDFDFGVTGSFRKLEID
jgi:superfamily I DNA/RNA helicase